MKSYLWIFAIFSLCFTSCGIESENAQEKKYDLIKNRKHKSNDGGASLSGATEKTPGSRDYGPSKEVKMASNSGKHDAKHYFMYGELRKKFLGKQSQYLAALDKLIKKDDVVFSNIKSDCLLIAKLDNFDDFFEKCPRIEEEKIENYLNAVSQRLRRLEREF